MYARFEADGVRSLLSTVLEDGMKNNAFPVSYPATAERD
jgi:hypothetical protein